jgi:hypothetical protein
VLGRITQPFLAVVGEQDRLIPWRHAEEVAAGARPRTSRGRRGAAGIT